MSNNEINNENTNTEIKSKKQEDNPLPNELNNQNLKEPIVKHTPLNENSKPYISKRFQKLNNNNISINNNIENKRVNYIKKSDFNENPICSYFNFPQKYLSEEYEKDIINNVQEKSDESNGTEENSENSDENENEDGKKNENIPLFNNFNDFNFFNSQLNNSNINININKNNVF